jgi:hypothetical protein
MPWVEFTDDFDWKPKPQITIAYRAGFKGNVTTPCAQAAVAKGVATKSKTPRKDDGNGSANNRTGKASKEAERDAEVGEAGNT